MRAARTLEGHHLLLNFERAAHKNDRDVRDELLQLGQIFEAVFAFVEDVIENDEVWLARGDRRKSVAASGDAFQFEIRKGVFIDLILQIVVFNDEKHWLVHGSLKHLKRGGVK